MEESRMYNGYGQERDKRCWHAYKLQLLGTAKFIDAVSKIVRGHHQLISTNGKLIDYGRRGGSSPN